LLAALWPEGLCITPSICVLLMPKSTTTVTTKYQVTIPRDVRRALKIAQGDRVAFVRTANGYVLRRAEELLDWLADTMEGVEETIQESRRGFRLR